MTLTDQESQPVNEEAQRVLKFFMSTLLNNAMPQPCEFDRMRSLTTLVPHYSEDVLYPIDADEVEYRTTQKPTPGKLTDLVGIMEGMEISTLQFLKIQFADEVRARPLLCASVRVRSHVLRATVVLDGQPAVS